MKIKNSFIFIKDYNICNKNIIYNKIERNEIKYVISYYLIKWNYLLYYLFLLLYLMRMENADECMVKWR
jgi:hypothetical protein